MAGFPNRITNPYGVHYPAFGVGMMPMGPLVGTTPFYLQAPAQSPLLLSTTPRGLPPRAKAGSEKPPVTTVFVGNIHDRCTNDLIRAMLQEIGNVVSWKRIQGSNGKYQAFGFCELEHPENTLRALRILHDFPLADKRLVVKVDEKTRELLREWVNRTRKEAGKPELQTKGEELPCDEVWAKEDSTYKEAIRTLVRNQGDNLCSRFEDGELSGKSPTLQGKGGNLDIESLDREKKEYIAREISQFRDQHKDDEEEEGGTERKKSRRGSPSGSHSGTPATRHRRSHDRTRARSRSYDSDRRRRDRRGGERRRSSRERRRRRSPSRSASASSQSSHSRSRSRSRSSHSSASSHSRSRSRSRSKGRVRTGENETRRRQRSEPLESEDEEDRREREKLERKLREKEEAYQQRLKKWEKRERVKAKDYERMREKSRLMRREEAREAKKLKEFLEDYDDERDDPKYYKSGSLFQRRREYEKERQEDTRDRQKEKEEVEELRAKLVEQGVAEPEAELARLQKEQEEALLRKLRADSDEPPSPRRRAREAAEEAQAAGKEEGQDSSSASEDDSDSDPGGWGKDLLEDEKAAAAARAAAAVTAAVPAPPTAPGTSGGAGPTQDQAPQSSNGSPPTSPQQNGDPSAPKMGFQGLKLGGKGGEGSSGSSLAARIAAFGEVEEEDDGTGGRKGSKLSFAVTAEERRVHMTPEERKKMTKMLIDRIPTTKDALFAFPIDWTYVDDALISKRVRPWVNKKIVEYIGEEEASLVDFICAKVRDHTTPATILEDIKMVLDDEAAVFCVKMWRLLIYEVEAKKLGIPAKD